MRPFPLKIQFQIDQEVNDKGDDQADGDGFRHGYVHLRLEFDALFSNRVLRIRLQLQR